MQVLEISKNIFQLTLIKVMSIVFVSLNISSCQPVTIWHFVFIFMSAVSPNFISANKLLERLKFSGHGVAENDYHHFVLKEMSRDT